MNDTPTPRTDACAKSIDQSNFADSWKDDFDEFAWVPADFARILECELIAAREELKAITEQLDEMTLRWELTNDSLFDKRALVDRLVEALRKIQKVGLVAVDAFDELDRIDEIVDEALQSLNPDHTVAANDMIPAVKGGADE